MKPIRIIPALSLGVVLLFGSVSLILGQSWRVTSAPINPWTSVASSADGSNLVAVANGSIFTSADSGVTWTNRQAPRLNWSSVSSSADGRKLVALGNGVPIYTSTNAGVTWEAAFASGPWQGVAGSTDGTKLVAVSGIEFQTGGILISTNSGVSWMAANTPTNGYGWYAVASSADGSRLAAIMVDLLSPGGPIGPIYTSTDSGATWTRTTQDFGWPISLASAADGTRLVAGTGVKGFPLGGAIFISTNSGATWSVTSAPVSAWNSVASSADGTRLVAGIGGVAASTITGPIFTSTDSGVSWRATDSPTNYWASVASSADGSRLVAAATVGGIYICQTTPTPILSATTWYGSLLFSWTVPSMNFVLQQTPDLAKPNWTNVAATPTLNYATLQYQVTIPPPSGTLFYRLASR